jgi:hypothetical protein
MPSAAQIPAGRRIRSGSRRLAFRRSAVAVSGRDLALVSRGLARSSTLPPGGFASDLAAHFLPELFSEVVVRGSSLIQLLTHLGGRHRRAAGCRIEPVVGLPRPFLPSPGDVHDDVGSNQHDRGVSPAGRPESGSEESAERRARIGRPARPRERSAAGTARHGCPRRRRKLRAVGQQPRHPWPTGPSDRREDRSGRAGYCGDQGDKRGLAGGDPGAGAAAGCQVDDCHPLMMPAGSGRAVIHGDRVLGSPALLRRRAVELAGRALPVAGAAGRDEVHLHAHQLAPARIPGACPGHLDHLVAPLERDNAGCGRVTPLIRRPVPRPAQTSEP